MGIRLTCPNGHKLHLKSFLAGRRGICPHCGARFDIPGERLPELPREAPSSFSALAAQARSSRERPPARHGSSAALAALDVDHLLGIHHEIPSAIDEAPAATWHVRLATGEQFGPADGPLMRQWLAEERVPAEAYVWREGWSDWRQASTVFEGLSAACESDAAVFPETFLDADLNVSTRTREALGKRAAHDSKEGRLFIVAMLATLFVVVPVLIYLVTR